jgi:antitoxin YefM
VGTIVDMSEYRTVTEAKAHLNEIVEALQDSNEDVVITRHGKPAAMVMSWARWEGLVETMDILSTPGALEEIRAAEARMDAGEYVTADELRKEFIPDKE